MKYPVFKFLIVASIAFPAIFSQAQDLSGLTWSDRVSKETADGGIVETPPIVEIGTIRLSRFSQMRSLNLQETIDIGSGADKETLYVFRAWQGGASQGEQLMLVTTSKQGVDIIGPHPQDFEKLIIKPANSEFGPIFELYGADKNKPIIALEYFDGQLIEL